ncbi:hypothetical protein BJ875DRAFT_373159 [Amylocarpus encephaloides]|uniref:ER transporter 6TM N-terminal domain-containing protein n=1 Tax=Amylocarpus encephaloides TaxID=45428 RepID=A0A9P8C6R7_9HELO|nr:hypothetical protein BJ875DRAFT_373159 [Amylocarpus encephaloides]
MVVLGQWAGIKARQHTTTAGASPAVARGYNSSASVVNAMFLLFNVWAINTLRAARPVFTIPSIQYTILVLVGFTYGPLESTTEASHRFVREVLYAFLTGQAISAAVCLLVIPVSSRKVFFGETVGFLQSCRGLLKKQVAFVEALEHSRICKPVISNPPSDSNDGTTGPEGDEVFKSRQSDLKTATAGILLLGSKLREDLVFATRETAYGRLDGKDIDTLHGLLRGIMVPTASLSTIADISVRMDKRGRHADPSSASLSQVALDIEHEEWLELVRGARESFQNMSQLLDEGITYILVQLRLVPGKKSTNAGSSDADPEKGQDSDNKASFADVLERTIDEFREHRSKELQTWAHERGLDSVFQSARKHAQENPPTRPPNPRRATRESLASARLHIILYMEYLLYSTSKAILLAVRFADSKVTDGTMSKKRFIIPTLETLTKWFKGILDGDENPSEDVDPGASGEQTFQLGDSFQSPRDPEHLPPKNFGQVLGNQIRKIPKFFGSGPVAFGFRVSVAVMSIGILAYLRNTHAFFVKQRVVWCLVMVSIGMNPTIGSAVFNLFGNLTFTVFGMIGAYINWYIVDEKVGGVIPVFFFFMMFYFYFAAKYPRFLVAIVAGALTHVLIIGYELQVNVIGLQRATATGQPFYPTYKLAPYRLLTVGSGVLVGYIWTIFPVPITEGSVLRRSLGGSLFLLANYLSCVSATVDRRLQVAEGGEGMAAHGEELDRARGKLLDRQLSLINGIKGNLGFMTFEPKFGGDFPKEIYEELVDEVQSITYYLTIIAYASNSFNTASASSTWLHTFTRQHRQTLTSSHALTTLFALLSASIKNGQALPPYLSVPTLPDLSNQATTIPGENEGDDVGVLGLNNVNEEGYRAVVVIEVAQRAVSHGVGRIVELTRELVGEVDFGHHVVAQEEEVRDLGNVV